MLFTRPAKPSLQIYAPTPTTISYTVSTRHSPSTIGTYIVTAISTILRLVLGVSTLLVLYAKYLHTFYPSAPLIDSSATDSSDPTILSSALLHLNTILSPSHPTIGHPLSSLLQPIPLPLLNPLSLITLYLLLMRPHTTESLLILRGLGVQTSTSSATYLTGSRTRFIPTTEIQDILIHEAFKSFEVRFYLAIVVKGEEGVSVVFPTLLPRREILETVWRGARRCLYEVKG